MTMEGKCRICGKESDDLELLLISSGTIWVCPECYKKISDMFDAVFEDEEDEEDGI